MLCSVLIPSRKRIANLIRALAVIDGEARAEGPADFEILIRFDEDDTDSTQMINLIEQQYPSRCFVGPRLGYAELDAGYYAGLEREAKGKWCWIAGDDMEVRGDWLGELRKVPFWGHLVQPEISRLGGSVYKKAEGQAFPIFPTNCWRFYAQTFPRPFDTVGHELLMANGWKTWFLPGVTMHHHEASPEELAKHREMAS